MKLLTYQAGDNAPQVGIALDEKIAPIDTIDSSFTGLTLMQVLSQLPKLKEGLARAEFTLESSDVRICAPISNPEKIICIGLNYADHAAESNAEIPSEPVVFNKFPTALRGPNESIELPPQSDSVDYEAELVVVIGREGKNISEVNALDYVAGYMCGHDVSARDWQKHKPQGQWLCGKSFDSFAPIGPYLVTADEVSDPHNLNVKFRLNGTEMQNSNTSQFIFNINQLLSYLSQVCTLKPGDLLFTGTPPGVGAARNPKVFLQPGDVAEVEIEGLGVLRNPVVAAD